MDHTHWIKPDAPPTSSMSKILKRFHVACLNTEQHRLHLTMCTPKKSDHHQKEEKNAMKEKFPGLNIRSAVCSLLYLAFQSRRDILFITCKLAKTCSNPGMKDFEALIWLFGYLRREWNLEFFYSDASKSPAYKIANTHKIEPSDILVFINASWQDCPDTGRSTTGYCIFYQGGVIEGNSQECAYSHVIC
eukprot:11175541-Ditylum_brightwellii.AAC.1